MNLRAAFACLGALSGLLLPSPSASADVLVEGTKFIEPYYVLDAGRFDEYCEHFHVVREGDTLEKIARDFYGDAARVADLERANPGIVATKLAIGRVLEVPAKKTPPADARETLAWRFYAWSSLSPTTAIAPISPGTRLAAPGRYSRLLAVPADRAAEFERLRDENGSPRDIEKLLAAAPYSVVAAGFGLSHTISDRSSAAESTTTFKIEELGAGTGGKPVFRVAPATVVYRDRKGREVEAGAGTSLPLLLLAALGAAGLLHRALRRRAAPAS